MNQPQGSALVRVNQAQLAPQIPRWLFPDLFLAASGGGFQAGSGGGWVAGRGFPAKTGLNSTIFM